MVLLYRSGKPELVERPQFRLWEAVDALAPEGSSLRSNAVYATSNRAAAEEWSYWREDRGMDDIDIYEIEIPDDIPLRAYSVSKFDQAVEALDDEDPDAEAAARSYWRDSIPAAELSGYPEHIQNDYEVLISPQALAAATWRLVNNIAEPTTLIVPGAKDVVANHSGTVNAKCGKWMPIAQARCALGARHLGACRSAY